MKKEEEKYCGECCWFYGEDTYGFGVCPFKFADVRRCDEQCGAGEHFVSKKQMRHYQAVLLVQKRWMDDGMFIHYAPDGDEVSEAIDFAVKYIKVFSDL